MKPLQNFNMPYVVENIEELDDLFMVYKFILMLLFFSKVLDIYYMQCCSFAQAIYS